MQTMARAFPVRSKQALVDFAKAIEAWPDEEKAAFRTHFGRGFERWYFQEIEGKPYVIVVTEAEELEEGYRRFASATDRFSVWFRSQIDALSNLDPTAEAARTVSEFIYELRA